MSEKLPTSGPGVLKRATILYDQPNKEEPATLRLVNAWCDRWQQKCQVSSYGRDGWILWDIEGPPEAIAELPAEALCDSGWARSR